MEWSTKYKCKDCIRDRDPLDDQKTKFSFKKIADYKKKRICDTDNAQANSQNWCWNNKSKLRTWGKGKDNGSPRAPHESTLRTEVSLFFSDYRTENWDQTELTIDRTPRHFDDDDDDNDVAVAAAAVVVLVVVAAVATSSTAEFSPKILQ